jgi:YD repeat-containing protein
MAAAHDPILGSLALESGSMTKRTRLLVGGAVTTVILVGAAASASETTTYSYDVLGRLVSSARVGGPNNGLAMTSCFDPAGNRKLYSVASTKSTCPAPTPSATPPP